MNYKNDFSIPSGTDFDKSVYLHLQRTQEATLDEDKMIVKKDYEINGMVYTVHSIFSLESGSTVDDKLRYLKLSIILDTIWTKDFRLPRIP